MEFSSNEPISWSQNYKFECNLYFHNRSIIILNYNSTSVENCYYYLIFFSYINLQIFFYLFTHNSITAYLSSWNFYHTFSVSRGRFLGFNPNTNSLRGFLTPNSYSQIFVVYMRLYFTNPMIKSLLSLGEKIDTATNEISGSTHYAFSFHDFVYFFWMSPFYTN